MKKKIYFQEASPQKFSSPAWLLLGLINSLPGTLQLHEGHLTYSAYNSGTLWPRDLRKLEAKLGIPALSEKLDQNQLTPLFKIPSSDIQSIHFPYYYFSAGMHLKVKGVKYRLSFIRPNNTRVPAKSMASAYSIPAAVRIGKEWKKLLLPK